MKHVDYNITPVPTPVDFSIGTDARESFLTAQAKVELNAMRQLRDAIDRQTWAIEQLTKTVRDGFAVLAHETPEYAGD